MDAERTAARVLPAHRAARAVASATVDTYEASMRMVSDVERILARTVEYEPISSLATDIADFTRDATAIRVSTIRWMLDL
jgi:hypothetical protein